MEQKEQEFEVYLKESEITNTIEFLNRTSLKGTEVLPFVDIIRKLGPRVPKRNIPTPDEFLNQMNPVNIVNAAVRRNLILDVVKAGVKEIAESQECIESILINVSDQILNEVLKNLGYECIKSPDMVGKSEMVDAVDGNVPVEEPIVIVETDSSEPKKEYKRKYNKRTNALDKRV